MSNGYALIWLIVLIVMIVTELVSLQMVSIWFAAGALLALVGTLLGAPFWVQLLLFVIGSLLLLVFTRPIVKKMMPKHHIPTNSELEIGKKATVIEDIDAETATGRVRLEGVDWSGVSENGKSIASGTAVIVKRIDGTKLIVAPDGVNINKGV